MTHSEISARRGALEKARREAVRTMMEQYDKQHYAELKVLRQQCGAIGHNMRFSHIGPVGHPWSYCTVCGASEVGELDE